MKPKTIQRTYLREAAFTLLLARVAVRVIPVVRIFAWAKRPLRRSRRFTADEIDWVLWAIDAAAKSHKETLCLPRALAAHAMLRRRGVTSRICLGVAREYGQFAAHAWVEVGKTRVAFGGDARTFTRLAEFGEPSG